MNNAKAPNVSENVLASPRVQLKVLTTRYWDCLFGDLLTVILLVLQAPAIGWLCTIVWGAIEHDTVSLYFVMSLACVWFGAINACREIVKERKILEKERLFGLSIAAYVGSKFKVLSIVGLLQTVLLQIAIEWKVPVQGPFLVQTLALWGASFCGIGLGLLVSALTTTQEKAVGLIPLLILPQILFSELALDDQYHTFVIDVLEKMMPVHWCFEVFKAIIANEIDIVYIVACFGALLLMSALLVIITVMTLLPKREV